MASRVLKIAHRGGAALYAENTLEAFDASLRFEIDGVECDIHLSSDGVPVVFHDDTLHRCTNGTGRIAETPFEHLRQLKIPHPFLTTQQYIIPTLEEALNLLVNRHNKMLFLEIKYYRGSDDVKSTYPSIAEKTLAHLNASKMKDFTVIISFDWNVLRQVRALDSKVRLGCLASSKDYPLKTEADLSFLLDQARSLDCSWLDLDARYFPEDFIPTTSFLNRMHQAGFKVGLWTVNSYAEMRRFANLGFDAITSDHPELLALI